MNTSRKPHSRQHGFGVIAALVVLVMLASIAAAIVRLNWVQQMTSAQDVMSAKATQAAIAGAEWGLYQALRGAWVGCTSSTQTLDLTASMGFYVTVTCTSNATAFVEGGDSGGLARSVRLYKIDAVACNGGGTCPDNAAAATSTYVERYRQVTATDVDTDS